MITKLEPMRSLSFLFLLLVAPAAFALQTGLSPYLRTYPVSTSLEATAKQDFLFWGENNTEDPSKFWQFGYVQPKVLIAAHGQAEASLQFAPISILEFSAAYSKTSRFYETKPFDCAQVICKGIVDRQRWGAKLALSAFGFESLISYYKSRLSNPDSSKRLVDEVEVLLADPGSDEIENHLIYLSKSGTPFGALVRKSRFLGAQVGNESQYFVLRHKMEDATYSLALGRYASDFSVPEFSVYATAIWTWGESKTLF